MKKIILIVLSVGLVATLFLGVRSVRVAKVECLNSHGSCGVILSNSLKKYENERLIESFSGIKKELMTSGRVKFYKLTLRLPADIIVDVVEKEPAIGLKPFGSDIITTYTGEGEVLGEEPASSLPTVEFLQKDNIDEKAITFIASLYNGLVIVFGSRNGLVVNDSLEFKPTDNIKFIFPLSGEPDVLLGAARLVFEELNRDHENPTMKTVDFRFKNPVLTTK